MAKYYDGTSAQSHTVVLQVDDKYVMGFDTAGAIFQWLISTTRTSSDGHGDRDIILSNKAFSDAKLHVSAAEFLELKDRLKGRGADMFDVSFRSIIAMFILAGSAIYGVYVLLPKAASPIANLIPYSWESSLGDQVFNIVKGDIPACLNPDGLAVLNHALDQLIDNAGLVRRPIELTVLDDGIVNALALPGDRMVFFRGLIDGAGSPDEVVAVMAHELAHIVENHPLEGLVVDLGMMSLVSMMFGGVGDLNALASTGQVFLMMSNSRDAEREADALAVGYMKASNINPAALAVFFARLQGDQASMFDTEFRYLSTHPSLSERISTIDQTDDNTSYDESIISEEDWAKLQFICDDTWGDAD